MDKLKIIVSVFLCVIVGCYSGKQITPYLEVLQAAKQTPPSSASDSLKAKIREQIPFEPKTADDFFLYAYIASTNEDYDSAKEYYSKAIKLKPDYAEAYYGIGNAYYSEEYDYGLDMAVEYFRKAIELKPDYAEAYVKLANIYYYINYHSKDEDKAIEYYKKALELESSNAEWHKDLADIYYNSKKDYGKAIEHCKKAIELDSSYYYILLTNNMGIAYAYKRDFDKALELHKKVLELEDQSGSHETAYYGMGFAYAGKKDYGKAVEYYKKSYELDTTSVRLKNAFEYFEKKRELDPSFDPSYGKDDYDRQIEYYKKILALDSNKTEIYYGMAFAYYKKKDYGNAIECYNKVLKLNSDTTTVYVNIGLIYYEMKDYDKAVEYMEKNLALEPDSSFSYYIIGKTYKSKGDTANASYYKEIVNGMAYYRRGNYDKAIERYEKAIGLKPDYAWAYYNMAVVEKNYYEAIEYYEKAIKLKPDFAEAYFRIGYNYYILLEVNKTTGELNKKIGIEFDKTLAENKAIGYLKKAAELNSKYMDTYPSQGDFYYAKGDYGSAIEYWEKRIKARPYYAEARYKIGTAYYAKGEYSKAIESFEKTLELNIYNSQNHSKEALELPPPPNANIYEYIGKVYFYGKKDLDKALEYYGKAVELVPDGYEDAYYNIGEIYREKGDKDLELHYKSKAAELRPPPLPPPPPLQPLSDQTIEELAQIYAVMKPTAALPILMGLDDSTIVRILKRIPDSRIKDELLTAIDSLNGNKDLKDSSFRAIRELIGE
jgi:tetratricopeptide (TPR) repeat protein